MARKAKAITEEPPANGTPDITQSSVLLTVKLRKPGNRRRVSSSRVEVDADKDAIAVSKELLNSPELKSLEQFDSGLRRWLYARALPASGTLREGVYRLPIALVEEVDEWLTDQADRRERLADNFMAVYTQRVTEAKTRLRALYSEDDYPRPLQVREAFSFEWRYMVMGVPDQLEGISAAMFQREKIKAKASIQAEVDQIKDALRTSFAELMERAAQRLAIGQDGKPLVFRDTLVGNLETFLQYFAARNVVNDDDLAAMVDRAREVLKGVSNAQVLRDDMALREKVRESFGTIRAEMDEGAMLLPKRQITLEDE